LEEKENLMAVNIQYEDPIGKLIESLPGILLEKKRVDIAAQEAEDLRDYRGAEQERLWQEAMDVKDYRESEQERLRQQEINLVAHRQESAKLEAHKEMMDLVETMAPAAQLAIIKYQLLANPQYMAGGQVVANELTKQVGIIEQDRTNFAKANGLIQSGDLSGAAEVIKNIKNPDYVATASNYLNDARKSQWEVSRPELSKEQQMAKMKLDSINERLELELDAREYSSVTGEWVDPHGESAKTIAGLRAQSNTAYNEFTALLAGTPVTPSAGGVTPPAGVVTPGGVVTPPVITPITRQYSFRVTSGKTFGVLGGHSIEILGPAGNSIEVEAAKADRVIKKGKRADRDNYLGRMKTLFGVDEAEAIKLLSKAYASRKGEVGELQGGTISVRVDSGLSSEDEEALDAVLQEYSEE
jgi:hypothetical protein